MQSLGWSNAVDNYFDHQVLDLGSDHLTSLRKIGDLLEIPAIAGGWKIHTVPCGMSNSGKMDFE